MLCHTTFNDKLLDLYRKEYLVREYLYEYLTDDGIEFVLFLSRH